MRSRFLLVVATLVSCGLGSSLAVADDDDRRERWHKRQREYAEDRREWIEEQRERYEERLEEQRERHEEWLEEERERREEWLEDRGWDDGRRFRAYRRHGSPFYSPAYPGAYYGRSPYYGYDRYVPRYEYYYRAPPRRGIWFSF